MQKLAMVLGVLGLARVALADCPTAVTEAAKKRVPGATITKCTSERSHYVVKLVKQDRSRIELDVGPGGEILLVEEIVPVSTLPEAVVKAFAARYPKATPERVERMTAPKGTSYEIRFTVDKRRREATFQETGAFVEEE